MGAEFAFQIMPWCEATESRKKGIVGFIDGLDADDLIDFASEYLDMEDLEYCKERLKEFMADYWDLGDRRDVGTIELDETYYIISGGMSWGDTPTEAYDILDPLSYVPALWRILKVWSQADTYERRHNPV